MARPPNLDDLPLHPSVDIENIEFRRLYKTMAPCAQVTCFECGAKRWAQLGSLRQQVKRDTFSGACRRCGIAISRAGHRVSARRASKGAGRCMTSGGYVSIGPWAVEDAELPFFRAMSGRTGRVAEHRWVMAKHLGRPLRSDELVDHKNGVKTDNVLHNLRLYVSGKQQPGSAPGHGTYYHEWQMAERRVRRLEAALAQR